MNGSRSSAVLSAVLCAAVLGAMSAAACADTRDEIIDRMAKRLPQLKKHKAGGKIGETFNGLVEAVKAEYLKEENLRKLVADENADRKAFYALTAEKFETTPEIVARSAGIRNFKAAESEHWLKLKDGTWVQKKNLEDVRRRKDDKDQKG
jgi:uncharacterized protein YdbL (DUF1318 family)